MHGNAGKLLDFRIYLLQFMQTLDEEEEERGAVIVDKMYRLETDIVTTRLLPLRLPCRPTAAQTTTTGCFQGSNCGLL